MMKKKQTLLNFFTGFFSQIIILILGFIVPRIVLDHFGSDANGLMSTITQVFTYMALLEAGISQSARNALFKPLQNKDYNQVSLVASTAKKYYRKVGIIYLLIVIFLSFLMPLLLKTQIDYWTVFTIIFFEGLTSAVSFYFTNIWNTILQADGKTWVSNLITFTERTLCYTLKIVLALFSVNIAFIQVGYFLISLIKLCLYWLYMKKRYSFVDYNINDKKYKLPDKNSYILTEVASVIFTSTDLIVLSIFVSTSVSSVYSIYNMIFVGLNSLLNSLYWSINYLLGQNYQNNLAKYNKIHDLFNSFFMTCITTFMCTSYVLTLPFIRIYTENITDINYIYKWAPLLFCIIQLLSWSRYVSGNLTGLSGYAKKTSYISLVEAIINIVASLILVQFYGMYGVLLGTIIALPIKVVFCNYISEKKVLKRTGLKTCGILGINYVFFSIVVIVTEYIDVSFINDYLIFALSGIVLVIIFGMFLFLLNGVVNKDFFRIFKYLKK